MPVDRRELLRQLSLLVAGLQGGAILSSCKRKPEQGARDAAAPDTGAVSAQGLLPLQRKTLEAALERILPTDQDPGAKEAGLIEYLDRELRRPEYAELRTHVVAGVVAMNRKAQRDFGKLFAEIPPEHQDEVLRRMQAGSDRGADFVRILVVLALEGFFGDPKWGGNRGGVGWELAGYGPGSVDGTVRRHAHH